MRAVLPLLLVVGCWTGEGARESTTPPDPTPPERDPYPLRSEWRGHYRCSQGLSSMTLHLEAEKNGVLKAVFEFGPSEDAPTVQRGSYRLLGTIRGGRAGTFEIALDPVEWIHAPDGYIMTSLSARSSRKWTRLVGRINHPGCGELDVRRVE